MKKHCEDCIEFEACGASTGFCCYHGKEVFNLDNACDKHYPWDGEEENEN